VRCRGLFRRGQKLNLSVEERQARAERARQFNATREYHGRSLTAEQIAVWHAGRDAWLRDHPDRYNPWWKHGRIREYKEFVRTHWRELKVWRRAVRERDGCCQFCGSKKDLHAHHMIPILVDQTLAFDLFNGLTLCRKCHYEAE